MEQGILYIVTGVVSVLCFLLGKYVFPQAKQVVSDLLNAYPMLMEWGVAACRFVEQYFTDGKGEKKNLAAAQILLGVAKQAGLDLSEEQARAIAQAAFEQWNKGAEQGA